MPEQDLRACSSCLSVIAALGVLRGCARSVGLLKAFTTQSRATTSRPPPSSRTPTPSFWRSASSSASRPARRRRASWRCSTPMYGCARRSASWSAALSSPLDTLPDTRRSRTRRVGPRLTIDSMSERTLPRNHCHVGPRPSHERRAGGGPDPLRARQESRPSTTVALGLPTSCPLPSAWSIAAGGTVLVSARIAGRVFSRARFASRRERRCSHTT